MTTILLAFQDGEMSPEHLAQIQAIAPDRELVVTQDLTRIEALLDDIEIAACSFPRDLLERAPKLRWFQNWGAGADWLLRYPALIERDLIVTNTSGVHAIPISEHILALMLAFSCRLPQQFQNQQKQIWQSPRSPSDFEIAGKTMLLIGVGAIGERTAQVASALGMNVIGLRRNPANLVDGVSKMVGINQLHDVLPQADFVVLTVPLTPETEAMIGEAELKLMRPNAYIINIGRGRTIDEPALIRALQEERIAGVGLDVVAQEPLDPASPLWTMPNVILTAHYSGHTPAYTERALEIFLDNLERYLAGRPLRNVVDKRLGY